MSDEDDYSHLPVGSVVGGYEILSVLGSGGFGVTYLAVHQTLDRKVALKECLPVDFAWRRGDSRVGPRSAGQAADFAWAKERFLQEARTLDQFKHENVVHIFDVFKANGTAYMPTGYVEGQDLEAWLKGLGRPPTEAEIRPLLDGILAGLIVVHAGGVLHRDLKPENIYVTDTGKPVLLDFGSARQFIGGRSRSMTSVLTPGYAPPEQYYPDGNQGTWTDIYGLCATLHRCLCGESPPDGSARARRGRVDPYEPLVERLRGRYSESLLFAIDSGLDVDEEERPQSVAELRDMLVIETSLMDHGTPTIDSEPSENSQANADQTAESGKGRAIVKRAILAGSVALVLVILGIFLVNPKRNAGSLVVRADPVGAIVEIEGLSSGVVPLSMTGVKAGTYKAMIAKEGFKSETIELRVENGKLTSPGLVVLEPLQRVGSLLIRTEPASAKVTVEGVGAGKSPYSAEEVKVGHYTAKIEMVGYAPKTIGIVVENRKRTDLGLVILEQDREEEKEYLRLRSEAGVALDGLNKKALEAGSRVHEIESQINALKEGEDERFLRYLELELEHYQRYRNWIRGYELSHPGVVRLKIAESLADVGRYDKAVEELQAGKQEFDSTNDDIESSLFRLFIKPLALDLNKYSLDKNHLFERYSAFIDIIRGEAENENGYAQYLLGWGCLYANLVELEKGEGVKWVLRSAENEDPYGQNFLGLMYRDGTGVAVNIAEALKWLRMSANQGNAMGQVNLAFTYDSGLGVVEDDAEAVNWYRKAAEQGFVSAQSFLGFMYQNGRGVTQDDSEAVNWYRKAADQGDATAQYNLGTGYQSGRGVAKDNEEAVKWYRRAAEQGYVAAQRNLGFMYASGRGVAQDDSEAVNWYLKAAVQGDATAQYNLGIMHESGRGVARDDEEAVSWYRKSAEQGDASAQRNLASMYVIGRGVAKDDEEAVKLYHRAAVQGDATAQFHLGFMYDSGNGVAQDDAEAVNWYRKAADQGNAAAQYNLGIMYTYGNGVEQNYTEALNWYRKAADQGFASAQNNLGVMYDDGRGVSEDVREAVNWYRKAAEQGDATAQRNLGKMYAEGTGVARDDSEAVSWYRKAAEQGDAKAKEELRKRGQ